MKNYVRLFRSNFGVVEWFVNFVWFCFYPFSILPIFSFLSNLTNINFGVEVRGKCFTMISGITINYIEIVNLIEMMFYCMGSKYTCYTRIETTTKYSR